MNDVTALYRKYRPSTFAEVLGQEHVVNALESAIAQGSVGHAYLFTGTRGTGKTSMARIFARAVGTDDCDLYELDAASNRGIDDIRALREQVHTVPFVSTYKVYIIDEVHMLTKEAFNALLKTLEEPPKHIIFILATTEPDKVPDTILSRCQVLTFKRPTVPVLKELVTTVAKKEGRVLEPAAAELVALLADGSFRDAHGMLQKVLTATTEKKVTAEDVESAAGIPQGTHLTNLLDAVAEGSLDKALACVRALSENAADMRTVFTLILRLVRAVLLVRFAPSLKEELADELSEGEYRMVERHAAESKARINSKFLVVLLDASVRVGTTYVPELPLELALMEYLGE